ncbi:response regulator [Nocardioides sp. GY 10127]|uniref:response regulator n=1 Tax=Nocardioides sp. GY 10127 TaxID=2569762 RepID=UPI0010A898FA|nr:response regulator [Nocardioides sp. GY 10127]TIC86578.1 response regulator [Nocardioides sp. GY 10127]
MASILVADDDEDLCALVSLVLSERGHRVRTVPDGLAAVDALRSTPFDLVVLDVAMPGLDAFGVLQSLEVDPQVGTPRVALLTAHHGRAVRRRAERFGVPVLAKPFDVDLLADELDSLLARPAGVPLEAPGVPDADD